MIATSELTMAEATGVRSFRPRHRRRAAPRPRRRLGAADALDVANRAEVAPAETMMLLLPAAGVNAPSDEAGGGKRDSSE